GNAPPVARTRRCLTRRPSSCRRRAGRDARRVRVATARPSTSRRSALPCSPARCARHAGRRSRSPPAARVSRSIRRPYHLLRLTYRPHLPHDAYMKPAILAVDDERAICIAIQRLLASSGYEADTASSRDEAIEKLARGTYHLVITDLDLKQPDDG